MYAVATGNVDLIAMLLEKGAKVNARAAGGATALHAAATGGRAAAAKLLLERGAEVDQKTDKGVTALLLAALNGRAEAAQVLLEKGADVNAPDRSGSRPLINAVNAGHSDMVALLLEKGADVNGRDQNRRTAMDYLLSAHALDPTQKTELVSLLIARGADVQSEGGEMLRIGAMEGNVRLVELVLERGLEFNAGEGGTAIRFAKDPEVLRVLKEAAVDDPEKWKALAELKARMPKILKAEKAGDDAVKKGLSSEALARYTEALRETPRGAEPESRLRGKAIQSALDMDPPPVLPDEATHHSDRAQSFAKRAQKREDFAAAAAEFEQALTIAPWWASGYFNLALVLEKTQDFDGAITNLKLYLRAAPQATDAKAVRKKIADLEVAKELAGGKGK